MTTNDLLSRVKTILDEYGVSSGSFQDAEIIDALSVGQHTVWSILASDVTTTGRKHILLENLITLHSMTVGSSSAINTIDGVSVRAGTVDLSTINVTHPISIVPNVINGLARWMPITPAEVGRGWHYRDTQAVYYYFHSGILYWFTLYTNIPISSIANVENIREPEPLSISQDPEIPAYSLFINYATYLLLHKLGKSDIAQIFYNAFINELNGVRNVNTQPNA